MFKSQVVLWGIPVLAGVSAVSYTHLDVYKRQDGSPTQEEARLPLTTLHVL